MTVVTEWSSLLSSDSKERSVRSVRTEFQCVLNDLISWVLHPARFQLNSSIIQKFHDPDDARSASNPFSGTQYPVSPPGMSVVFGYLVRTDSPFEGLQGPKCA